MDPHDPIGDSSFERERLHELIDEADLARRRRDRGVAWLLGLGLAAVLLGLPSGRLWGDMELVGRTGGSGEVSVGLLFPLAKLLTSQFGIGAEQAVFLLAAISYGLLVPATLGLLRTVGFDRWVALGSATAILFTPVLVISAGLPIDFAPGVLGATWLLTSLFKPPGKWAAGYQWRAVLAYFVAFLLRPENALLLPAVAWAVGRQAGAARAWTTGALTAVTGAFAVGLTVGDQTSAFWPALLGGGGPSGQGALLWLGYLTLGHCLAAFALWGLLFDRRAPEETPAPKWMVPWCLVALVPVLAGHPMNGPVAGFLMPAAAVGLADWLTRRDREQLAVTALKGMVPGALGLVIGLRVAWDMTDPLREERAALANALEEGDTVVGGSDALQYLCQHRFGLVVVDELGEVEESPRVVLLDAPRDGEILHAILPVHVWHERKLTEVAAGASWEP